MPLGHLSLVTSIRRHFIIELILCVRNTRLYGWWHVDAACLSDAAVQINSTEV